MSTRCQFIVWDDLAKQVKKVQPGLEPYKTDPFKDNIVMMYGCQLTQTICGPTGNPTADPAV